MHIGRSVLVTNTLTPHDISVLVLVAFYCGNVERVSPSLISTMIPPLTSDSQDAAMYAISKNSNPPLPVLPTLEELIQRLFEKNHSQAGIKLLAVLDAINNLNGVTRLLKILDKQCLRLSYRAMDSRNEKRVFKRQLTRKSVLGSYLARCVTKHMLEDFQDSERLWNNLVRYRDEFKLTKLYKCSASDSYLLDPVMSFIVQDKKSPERFGSVHGMQEVELFQNFTDLFHGDENSMMMISKEHLQALLNAELTRALHDGGQVNSSTREILSHMTLEDKSRFPTVHILNYLQAMANQEYDTSIRHLYRYFDYMLGQNSDHYFHMSLLSLATFHSHFNNDEAAVKTFEEAIAVARENKDISTLNLILIWVFEFIKKRPNLAGKFHVTTEQIVTYLRTCPDSHSLIVFEKAYLFESLFVMLNGGFVPDILEAAFKSFVIGLQGTSLKSEFGSIMQHNVRIWKCLGSSALTKAYENLCDVSSNETMFSVPKYRGMTERSVLDEVRCLLSRLDSPSIEYEERRQLERLKIEYLSELGDFNEAIKLTNNLIKQCQFDYTDTYWEFEFTLIKCRIFMKSGLGPRCKIMVESLIDNIPKTRNAFSAAKLAVLLSQLLFIAGEFSKAIEILNSNVHVVLQFTDEDLREDYFTLYLACFEKQIESVPKTSIGITREQLITLKDQDVTY
ncbi:LAFE_0G08306g1_1 [Lachancea fermentati]|uniref:Anaphase-promoting complex subunit 5 n=1 Tax=Lachancea fermentati TaxID=4955 RepID=A0A1G4MHM3_LACFM|nr:LAFE_0G08306g1_1 [Lachancea fermentati]